MAYLRWLAAKQKAEAAARIAKKVARGAVEPDGLNDLPLEIAVAIELNSPQPEATEPAVAQDDDVPGLVSRLTAIRERIWRLQAMFAVSLSLDCAMEANRYLTLFQDIAHKLGEKDPAALEALTRGHESLLLSPPIAVKQSIPLETQRLCEMRWEAMTQPSQRPPKRPTVPDGLDWMVGT